MIPDFLISDFYLGKNAHGKRRSVMNSSVTRRSWLKACLAAWPGIAHPLFPSSGSRASALPGPGPESAISSSERITVRDGPGKVIFSNGIVTVECEKKSGLANYSWGGARKVKGAYSTVQWEGLLRTTDYAQHKYQANPKSLSDGLGRGCRFTIVHSAERQPDILQRYSFYEGKPFFLVQTEIRSPQGLGTNHIGAVVVDGPEAAVVGTVSQNRVLRVPFDNDMWFRYNAMDIHGSDVSSDVSSEVTAVYDNVSRNGLVFGSVTHDTWKTGIAFSGSNGRLHKLEVFAGMATDGLKSATHDSLPHGKVSGESVNSPVIFVGYFEDWREGLEAYGRTNAVFKPPFIWNQEIPFGWNSWAAYGERIDYSKYVGAAEFISRKLAPNGFNHNKVVYLNLDAFWSRLDESQLRDALEYLKNLQRTSGVEFRAGIYMAPFAQWGENFDGFVEGTNLEYRYRDILLKKPDGTPLPKLAGGTPLDPTHPGTQARIRAYFQTFKALGFCYLKLDFLSHATLEGLHWEKSVKTGIQAYNHGMKFILDEIGNKMFISLSIAPLFPGGYGHARRISCDTMGHISGRNQSVEYMLNSLTYGWWTSPSVYIADPDEIPLGPVANEGSRNENEARSRFLSAVISGGMILDSSAFLDDPAARDVAPKVYTNPRINALAATGKPFRPVEGDTGDQAADVFVREENGTHYLAVFNFNGDSAVSKLVPLERVAQVFAGGKPASVTDVWTDSQLGSATGTLRISLGPAESKLLRLAPVRTVVPRQKGDDL